MKTRRTPAACSLSTRNFSTIQGAKPRYKSGRVNRTNSSFFVALLRLLEAANAL
jgi:hypothetical protein